VQRAVSLLGRGNLQEADRLLHEVAAIAPAECVYSYLRDGSLQIKFWTQDEFLNYVMWQQGTGTDQNVTWIPSAYPRALYHLGFIRVATGDFEEAIQYLQEGRKLEPSNPKFIIEVAQANVQLGRFWAAIALLSEVDRPGPHTSAQDLGVALRAEGFILIEMGELDLAEEVYAQSLEFDPRSDLALNQLRYIDHLRKGGRQASVKVIENRPQDTLVCHRCGAAVREGRVTSVNGRIVGECAGCEPMRQ